jgi:hypothetical protein
MLLTRVLGRFVYVLLILAVAGPCTSDAAAESEAILIGAGDVGQCGGKPASETEAAKTAALIEQIAGTVFVAGDLVYPYGEEAGFRSCYDPTWGRFKARTLPVPGNHDYAAYRAAPYYAYWGRAAGEPGKGYYSVEVGNWRVIALNSMIEAGAGSEQERWLRAELTAHPTHCTLAFWHHPLISSGLMGNNPKMRDIFQALYEGGVDVVINGHDHVYERFAPQDAQGRADSERGIRVFIVGTGGASLQGFSTVRANSEVRQADVFGVIKLTLRVDAYTWEFIPIEGQTFRDSGEGKCHD